MTIGCGKIIVSYPNEKSELKMRVSTFTIGGYLTFPVEFLNEIEAYISSQMVEFPFTLLVNEEKQTVHIKGKQDGYLTERYKGYKEYIEAIMLEEVCQIIEKKHKEHFHDKPYPYPFANRMELNGRYFVNRDNGYEGAYIITQLFPIMVTPYIGDMCLENEFISNIMKNSS